jgi:DNA-binding transcriptional LysR family regulator
VNQLLLHHDTVGARVKAVRERKSGSLVVAASAGLLGALISRAAATFSARKTDINLRLEAHPIPTILELVVRQEVDMGFVYSPVDLSKVRSIPICHSEIICTFQPGHRLASQRAVTPTDLRGERIITLGSNAITGLLIREALMSGQYKSVVETNTSVSAMTMVMEGGGVALIDSVCLGGAFRSLPFARFKPRINFRIFAIYSRDRVPSRVAQDFVDDLSKIVKDTARMAGPSIQPMSIAGRF